MNCEYCQSPVHVWFQCPKKPDGWKPARLAKRSTGFDPKPSEEGIKVTVAQEDALTSAPVDTNSPAMASEAGPVRVEMAWGQNRMVRGGGPERAPGAEIPLTKPKFDKKAWMRTFMKAYMAQYRADVKSGARVPKKKAR